MVNMWQGYATASSADMPLIECDHGCAITTMPNEPKHPVCSFMDAFIMSKGKWWNSLKLHETLWSDDTHRKVAIDILLSIGVRFLMSGEGGGIDALAKLCKFASTILVLENCDESGGINTTILAREVTTKRRDLRGGNIRDVLKFFSKRTSCSCLKKMYSDARKILPKVGKCVNCKGTKERKLLSVCSRCRVFQYCSRECQVAHWPEHETECDAHVLVHNKHNDGDGKLLRELNCVLSHLVWT